MSLGEQDESNNPDKEQRSYTCPKCGEDQYNLPLHMQGCYGDTDE